MILKSYLGCSYKSPAGQVSCWQLIDTTGHAVATADFVDGYLDRFLTTNGHRVAAIDWLSRLAEPYGYMRQQAIVERGRKLCSA